MNQTIIVCIMLSIFSIQVNIATLIFNTGNTLDNLDECLCDIENNARSRWTQLMNEKLTSIITTEKSLNIYGFGRRGCLSRARSDICDLSFKAQSAIQQCYNNHISQFQSCVNSAKECGARIHQINTGTSLTLFCPDHFVSYQTTELTLRYEAAINDVKNSYETLQCSLVECFESVENQFCQWVEKLKYQLNNCVNDYSYPIVCYYNVPIFYRVSYQC